jgi:predicted small secreted protein
MKIFIALITVCTLSACGTIGGTISGAGDDLKAAGGWIKKQGS